MVKIILTAFVCLFLISSSTSNIVTYVIDGDTIKIGNTTIRVAEIDCPEKSMPYGYEAKQFTFNLTFHKNIQYQTVTTDRYGRYIAKVNVNGFDLGEALVKNGLAWQYKRYSHSVKLAALEKYAREHKLGLWKQSNPQNPEDYRHRN